MANSGNKSSVYIIPSSGGGTIHFDVVKEIGLSRTKTITKNKISDGSFITDHISETEDIITMECSVTDSPLVLYDGNIITAPDNDTRSQAAYLVMKDLFEKSTMCNIVHRFDTRNSFVLTSYEPIILPSKSIGFRLKFEAVKYASEQRIGVVSHANMSTAKASDSASPKNSKGDKTDVTENKSLVNKFLPNLGAALKQTGDSYLNTPEAGTQ